MTELSHDLFLLMGQLFQLSSPELILNLFVEALNEFDLDLKISKEKVDDFKFPQEITAKRGKYGVLYANVNTTEINSEFAAILQNAIQMLGIILEKLEFEKLLNEKVLENEENLKILINSIPDIVCIKDSDGKWLNANKAILKTFYLEDVDYYGKTNLELAEFSINELKDAFFKSEETDLYALKTKQMIRNEEAILDKEGNTKIIDMIKIPVLDKNDNIKRLVEIGRDITDRIKMEQSLAENELKYRTYINNSPVALFIVNEYGQYIDVNKSAVSMLGYTFNEFLQLSIADITYEKNANDFNKLKQTEFNRHERMLRCKDGDSITVDLVSVKLSETRYMAFCIDISEKKQLETQLLQSQKLESIGNLAAGIAHDFNNLLTVIMGNADLLRFRLKAEGFEKELIGDIIDASQKASELTKKMLLFSRKEKMEFKPVNLNVVIKEILKILQRLIGENIKISINLDSSLSLIGADKNNIEQVILNIASNARDAMSDGGNLYISTKNITIDKYNQMSIPYSRMGNFVLLSFEDDGCGIEKSVLDKIFDPFFTTKEVGKGTGMGMSVVYGIIKKHQGWINVFSEIEQGTVIKIYLPIYEDEEKEIIEDVSLEIDIDERNETILFIEDNPGVLKFGNKLLSEFGFIVDTARNAEEARQIFNTHKYDYDMVISDVVLPDTNGVELIEEFKEKNAKIKILLLSGYTNKKLKLKIDDNKEIFFLSKPFNNVEFIQKIISILDG